MENNKRNGGIQLHINDFPEEILFNIFSRLPISALSHCRYVCKSWLNLVHNPHFLTTHFAQSTKANQSLLLRRRWAGNHDLYLLEHESNATTSIKTQFRTMNLDYEIVGSCNGLLCLTEPRFSDPVYLCNPLLGEYMSLPKAAKYYGFPIISGFGFAGEFKVVRLLYLEIRRGAESVPDFVLECEVYTLGTNSWRKIGNAPYPVRMESSQAFVNGAVHWMMECSLRGLNLSEELIISFDLREEKFSLVPNPGFGPEKESYNMFLTVLGGCLSIVDCSWDNFIEVWIMKDYNVKDSWSKQFTIPKEVHGWNDFIRPLCIWKDTEILVAHFDVLLSYSPEENLFKHVKCGNQHLRMDDAIPIVGSLVSLKEKINEMQKRESGKRKMRNQSCTTRIERWHTTLYPVSGHTSLIGRAYCS